MKITIMANTFALTSDITVAQIELLRERNPDALKLKDNDGNDVFAINYAEGKHCVSNFGITFGAKARDGSDKMVVVGTIPANISTTEEAKSFVEKVVHKACNFLKALELSVPTAATAVATARNALFNDIEVY